MKSKKLLCTVTALALIASGLSGCGFVNISWHIFRKDFTLMLLKLMPHNTFAV